MTRNFYNQEKNNLKKLRHYQDHKFYVEVPKEYSLTFFEELNEKVRKFFEHIKPTKFPTLFTIEGNFDRYMAEDEADRVDFLLAILNLFAAEITTEKRLSREKRLAVPDKLKNVRLSAMNILTMVNNEILFPIVSFELLNEADGEIFEVMNFEDSNTDAN